MGKERARFEVVHWLACISRGDGWVGTKKGGGIGW